MVSYEYKWDNGNYYFLDDNGVMLTNTMRDDYVITSNGERGNKVTTKGWFSTGSQWRYLKDDASIATGWFDIGGTRYYLKANGDMATGWVSDNAKWYYLDKHGIMVTGWVSDSGKWYYLNSNGEMSANCMQEGYRLGSDGVWTKDDVKSIPFKDISEHRLERLSKYDNVTVSGDFVDLFRQSAYYTACDLTDDFG